jgi:hypothetical protein
VCVWGGGRGGERGGGNLIMLYPGRESVTWLITIEKLGSVYYSLHSMTEI